MARTQTVILIRHGERLDESNYRQWKSMKTDTNWHDPPLTDAGRMQARSAAAEVRKWLKEENVSEDKISFFASPSSRTLATATEVGLILGTPPVSILHGLYECTAAAGEWGLPKLILPCPTKTLGEYPITEHQVDTGATFASGMADVVRRTPPGAVAIVVTHREGIRQLSGDMRRLAYCATHKFSVDVAPCGNLIDGTPWNDEGAMYPRVK